MPKTTTTTSSNTKPAYRLRRSPIHGTGMFATRVIKKGAGIIEYLGERISHTEADRRHSKKDADDGHTFLFTVNSRVVIDAGVGGNEARYINHSCEPNCEVINDKGRLFVEAAKTIQAGEELKYDYNIGRTKDDPPNVEEIFACRCGSRTCRGNMLSPKRSTKKKTAKKKAAGGRKSAKRPTSGTKRTVARGKSGKPGTASKKSGSQKTRGVQLKSKAAPTSKKKSKSARKR